MTTGAGSPSPSEAVIPPVGAATRALAAETVKYFLVSLAALAVDAGLGYGLKTFLGVQYLLANALGFTAGLAVNYGLSVAYVFRQRRLSSRGLEFAGFMAIGLVGLGLNEILMKLFVETVGLSFILAKIPTTGLSFVFNFGLRRALLFTARPRSRS